MEKKYFEPRETSVIDIKEDLEENDVSFNIVGENDEEESENEFEILKNKENQFLDIQNVESQIKMGKISKNRRNSSVKLFIFKFKLKNESLKCSPETKENDPPSPHLTPKVFSF